MNEIEALAIFSGELVRRVEPLGGVGDDATRNFRRHHRSDFFGASHQLAQRLAVQILHRDPIRIVVFSQLENGCDVRVRNARSHARFIQKHLHERVVLDQVRVDALDGDPLLKSSRAIHAPEMHARHSADADFVDDAVAPRENKFPNATRNRACCFRDWIRSHRDVGRCRSSSASNLRKLRSIAIGCTCTDASVTSSPGRVAK